MVFNDSPKELSPSQSPNKTQPTSSLPCLTTEVRGFSSYRELTSRPLPQLTRAKHPSDTVRTVTYRDPLLTPLSHHVISIVEKRYIFSPDHQAKQEKSMSVNTTDDISIHEIIQSPYKEQYLIKLL